MSSTTVDALISRLGNPDEGARREAVDGLECHPSLQSFEALVWAASKSRDASLRRRASDAAERVARSLWEKFTEQLPRVKAKELDPHEAVWAAVKSDDEALCRAGAVAAALLRHREVVPSLRNVLKEDISSELRAVLLQSLGFVGGKNEVALLTEWATKGEPAVGRAAVIGLAVMRKARSYAALCPLLGLEERAVSNLALRYLRRLPIEQLEKLLANMLGAQRRGNVGWAIETCRLMVPPHWRQLLRPLLKSENGFIRSKTQAAIDFLEDKTDEQAPLEQQKSAQTLKEAELTAEEIAKIVEENAQKELPLLLAKLADGEDSRLRAILLSAIGALGRGEHIEIILPYFKDADARVRANAIEAVGTLKIHLRRKEWKEKVVPHLIDALSDETNRVIANAALALVPKNRDAVRWALEDLIYCGGEEGQKSAMYVIESAGPDSFRSLLRYMAKTSVPSVRHRAQTLRLGLKSSAEDVAATLAQVLGTELRESFGG